MDATCIKKMFEGIDEPTKEIIVRKLREQLRCAFAKCVGDLKARGLSIHEMAPPPPLIMNAFRLTSLSTVRVVLLGQDPYTNPGEAHGLSFSVPDGVGIPPSLNNIYKCLQNCGLVGDIPSSGNLESWAKQGVLLLNSSLTTQLGVSGAHTAFWEEYSAALMVELSNLPQRLVFILLGRVAQCKAKYLDQSRHMVFEWGHPSPMNQANKTKNPKNFKNCNVFTRTNETLAKWGQTPVDWNVTGGTVVSPVDTLWLFTDGGARGVGKPSCVASWGFCTAQFGNSAKVLHSASGIVQGMEVEDGKPPSSHNRGELIAIMNGMTHLLGNIPEWAKRVIIVSDSKYSIGCLDKWCAGWLADPVKHAKKKNLDIVLEAKTVLDKLRAVIDTRFRHVNSHQREPADRSSLQWFIWYCNDLVDKSCTAALV